MFDHLKGDPGYDSHNFALLDLDKHNARVQKRQNENNDLGLPTKWFDPFSDLKLQFV